ncbi:YciI family protein [Neobacillus sp. M.A.Huq-85]|nr:YciI family protein [Neobacillus cucumis]
MKKYLVLIERKPSFTGDYIQVHREFLQSLREQQLLIIAGGFEDQTGGAYVVTADSLEEAKSLVNKDPMNQENESVYTVKEWNAN